MNRVRVALALSLVGLVIVGSGCASKATKASPRTEPAPVTGEHSPAPQEGTPADPDLASGSLLPAFFGLDSHELNAKSRTALDHAAQVMRANPGLKITIEGHCDERGTVEYNLALGERRARAARDYLVLSGISTLRMAILSFGEERPFQSESNETAWAQNRRAHLVEQ